MWKRTPLEWECTTRLGLLELKWRTFSRNSSVELQLLGDPYTIGKEFPVH